MMNMHSLVRWCLTLLVCLVSSASADTLKVLTWNLEWFPGNSPDATPEAAKLQMERAQKALTQLKPDVVLFQEVRDQAAAEELCKVVPGLQVQVVSHFGDRPQNLVIASKLPVDSGWFAPWKTGPLEPPRGYSFAALQLPGGRFLLCYSLHLKSNHGELRENLILRHESSSQLLRHIQEMLAIYSTRGPCAVVIGGDFNTSLDDKRFQADLSLRAVIESGFYWSFADVPAAKRVTIPATDEFPANTFDHIVTAGLGKPVASVPLVQQEVSDHNPVMLEVDLVSADFAAKPDIKRGLKLLASAQLPAPRVPALAPGTFKADEHELIKAAVGKIAVVRGKISKVSSAPSGSIVFLNFEGNQRGQFVAIVRKSNVEPVVTGLKLRELKELDGAEVEIRGELVLFKETPQIEIKAGTQIKRIQ